MSKKNNPIYEIFSKGIMNSKHKGMKFDENGNVVCELNAEFGADVEVDGSLTINSAKDLKTKDGSSFGGEVEYVVATYNESIGEYDKLSASDVRKLKEGAPLKLNNFIGYPVGILDMQIIMAITLTVSDNTVVLAAVFVDIDNDGLGKISEEVYPFPDITTLATKDELSNYATKTDLNAKQSTLYRHTIDIDAGGLGLHTYVTALSKKNTVIDSIQDLVAVFGNTKLMATGSFGSDSEITAMLEVGTTMLDTYVHSSCGTKLSLSNWANYGPDETNFVITDSVTPM